MIEIREKINAATIGLHDLLTKAETIKANSNDYIIRKPKIRNNIWFGDDGNINFTSDDGAKVNASLSDYAIGQLGSRIGVPGQYIQSCIEIGFYKLAKDNVNTWLSKCKSGFMFRKTDHHIRAVLSLPYRE